MIVPRATNILARTRAGIARAQPTIARVRKFTDAVDKIADSPIGEWIPGSGVISKVAGAVRVADKIASSVAK